MLPKSTAHSHIYMYISVCTEESEIPIPGTKHSISCLCQKTLLQSHAWQTLNTVEDLQSLARLSETSEGRCQQEEQQDSQGVKVPCELS